MQAYLDTNIIIRFLTSDDLAKQKAAAELFEKVAAGEILLFILDTVIADTVYVLSSPRLYNLERGTIRAIITPLINLPGCKLENKKIMLRALDIFASSSLDFGDALLIANTENSSNKKLYSYDHDFDRYSKITRIEP